MTTIIQASCWNKAGIWSDRGGFSWEPRPAQLQPTLCCRWLLFPHKYNTSISMRDFSDIYHEHRFWKHLNSNIFTVYQEATFLNITTFRQMAQDCFLLTWADSKHWACLQEYVLSAGGPSGNPTSKAISPGSATQPLMCFDIKHTSALHIRTDTKAQSAKSSFHHGDWLHLICN